MILNGRLGNTIALENRRRETAAGILGLVLVGVALFAVWSLLTTKKVRIFGPLFCWVVLPLAGILLVSYLRAAGTKPAQE